MVKTIARLEITATASAPSPIELGVVSKPNGVAAAAILAAAISSLVLGLMIVTTEAIPAWKTAVTFVGAVGPLSGKTDIMVAAYVGALVLLTAIWRGKTVDFGRVWTASLVFIALGLLGSFPLFYELFTAH
jgi:hypothetical protein